MLIYILFLFTYKSFDSYDTYVAFGFDDPSRPTASSITLTLFFRALWAPIEKVLTFLYTSTMDIDPQYWFSYDQSDIDTHRRQSLDAMHPVPYYSTYYSHPPLAERLRAMLVEFTKICNGQARRYNQTFNVQQCI